MAVPGRSASGPAPDEDGIPIGTAVSDRAAASDPAVRADDGDTAEKVVQAADAAMYRVKESTRNAVGVAGGA